MKSTTNRYRSESICSSKWLHKLK